MRCIIFALWGLTLTAVSLAGPFSEFPVSSALEAQENPDVDGEIVVWQEGYGSGENFEWDVVGSDLEGEPGNYFIFDYPGYSDINPAISGNLVVWQNVYTPIDSDIYLGNITTGSQTVVSAMWDYNETHPDIHGNLVVWQERNETETETFDWNIYSADILNPSDPNVQPVCIFTEDQAAPAIYRSNVVFADFYTPEGGTGSWDITVTDTWLRDEPTHSYPTYEPEDESAPAIDGDLIAYQWDYYGDGSDYDIYVIDRSDSRVDVFRTVSDLESSEVNPAVSGQIVVWQDDRNGNWDIYGLNLVTGQQFQITDDPADQMYPAVSGNLVVWQDEREEVSQIYGAYLVGDVVASCEVPVAGDVDGNCRVDLADFAQMAQNWMICGLDSLSACNN